MVIMKTKFFFDLEETLITDWHDPVLCKVQRVKQWITDNNVKQAGVFSWAVWDQKDVDVFNSTLKNWLEGVFEVEFVEVVPKKDAVREVCVVKGLQHNNDLDLLDAASIFGKHGIFTEWCLARERDCVCVLLDDAVPDRVTIDHDTNVTVKLVNVDKLS
jgi:hypothetical protein